MVAFLSGFGIDYPYTEEVFSWDLGNESDSLIHHEGYYGVFGSIEGGAFQFEQFGVKISFQKSAFVPCNKTGAYFWICIEGDFPYILNEPRELPISFSPKSKLLRLVDKIKTILRKNKNGGFARPLDECANPSPTRKEHLMSLRLIPITPDCPHRTEFEQINNEAFPPSERMGMEEMFSFTAHTDSHLLGIYDDRAPIGFILLLQNTDCAYLYYLAIHPALRSKGYGGAALQLLQATYSSLQIILDFEEIDETAPNNAQRMRRKEFYLRNGFHETGTCTLLGDTRFEVVCNQGALCKESFGELLRILHAHRGEFSDGLFAL